MKQSNPLCKQNVAISQVVSKEHFFERLGLVSHEGRHAANSLLKRLDLYIFALSQEPSRQSYFVSEINEIPMPFSPVFANLNFIADHEKERVMINAMRDELVDFQVIQGELTPLQALLEKTESWDELPEEFLAELAKRK